LDPIDLQNEEGKNKCCNLWQVLGSDRPWVKCPKGGGRETPVAATFAWRKKERIVCAGFQERTTEKCPDPPQKETKIKDLAPSERKVTGVACNGPWKERLIGNPTSERGRKREYRKVLAGEKKQQSVDACCYTGL